MLSLEDQRRFEHAVGYLELGMLSDANDSLDEIVPENRTDPDVLSIRLEIHTQAQQWPLAVEIARHLFTLQPGNPEWAIQLACSIRRAESVSSACVLLLEMEKRFPENATIQFNLGCYAAQLGKLDEAVLYVKRAIELEKSFQEFALEDEDLKPIWDNLRELTVR